MKTKTIITAITVCILAAIPAMAQSADSDKPVFDHNLFVGIDLSYPYENNFYPITSIRGQNLIIEVQGQVMSEPMSECASLQFRKIAKVSPNFIQVNDIICKSDYSLENDPAMRAGRTHVMLANAAAQATAVQNVGIRYQQELQGTSINAGSGPGANATASNASIGIANQLQSVQSAIDSTSSSIGMLPGELNQADLEAVPHDVLRLEFSAAAMQEIPDPTLFMILRLKKTEEGDVSATWFHFAPLHTIPVKQDHFSMVVPSFPDGMIIDSYELYFFSGATEIATTLSDKRIAMPRQDAKSYLIYQYIDAHEGATLPAALVWKTLRLKGFVSASEALLDTRNHLGRRCGWECDIRSRAQTGLPLYY